MKSTISLWGKCSMTALYRYNNNFIWRRSAVSMKDNIPPQPLSHVENQQLA